MRETGTGRPAADLPSGDRQQACLALLDRLMEGAVLSPEEWRLVLEERSPETAAHAARLASGVRDRIFGNRVYIRGLIEFTNYCRNDCYYCGIRRSNCKAERYRLREEEILECCREGYRLGFRTFVLQGGEDGYFTDERLCRIVRDIKEAYPDCALTLSVGERSRESYQALREAGADRYLLRHETADEDHYRKLHPAELTLKNRMDCLRTLKELGFQTGAGMMIGSPGQTTDCLVEDLLFLRELEPEMIGIGPFLPHRDTPFREEAPGSAEETLYLLSLIRLMLPKTLLPATTALGTASQKGRSLGILAGANVIMPNLSPVSVRSKYQLYNNKLCTGTEAAEHLRELEKEMQEIGFRVVCDRGDYPGRA